MASSLFLLASLSLAFLCTCQADLISEVCSKTLNRPLCIQVLTSDPRARVVDLKGLGVIVIEKAIAATEDGIKVVKSVSNPELQNIVETCVETSNDGIDNLNECSQLLKDFKGSSKSYIQREGSAAMANVRTCDEEFGYKEPVNVKVAYKRSEDLINIFLVIANSL